MYEATYAEYSSVKWGAPRAFVIPSLKRYRATAMSVKARDNEFSLSSLLARSKFSILGHARIHARFCYKEIERSVGSQKFVFVIRQIDIVYLDLCFEKIITDVGKMQGKTDKNCRRYIFQYIFFLNKHDREKLTWIDSKAYETRKDRNSFV